jgi:ankyrin repeat protein
LFIASRKGYPGVVEMLLAANADANTHTEDGLSPLDVAEKKGHIEIAQMLREYMSKTTNKINKRISMEKEEEEDNEEKELEENSLDEVDNRIKRSDWKRRKLEQT